MSTASGDDYAGVRSAYRTPAAAQTAETGGRRSRATQWPFWAVILTVVASFVAVILGDVATGLAGLTAALSLAAVLRVTLPHHMAGWLTGRSRPKDAVVFAALAVGLGFVSRLM